VFKRESDCNQKTIYIAQAGMTIAVISNNLQGRPSKLARASSTLPCRQIQIIQRASSFSRSACTTVVMYHFAQRVSNSLFTKIEFHQVFTRTINVDEVLESLARLSLVNFVLLSLLIFIVTDWNEAFRRKTLRRCGTKLWTAAKTKC
jgi:hypothetical protein